METLAIRDYPRVHDTLNGVVRMKAFDLAANQTPSEFLQPYGIPKYGLSLDLAYLRLLRRQLQERPSLKPWEVDSAIESTFRSRRQDEIYKRIIERIHGETGYFHEFEEMGMMDALRASFDVKKVAGVKIHWDSSFMLPGDGEFDPIHRIIKVRMRSIHPLTTLRELALTGRLPNSVLVLKHEVSHSYQVPIPLFPRLGYILSAFFHLRNSDKELTEAHAYRTENHSDLLRNPATTVQMISESKKRGKLIYEKLNVKKLAYAVMAVDMLNALGLTDIQIGRILQNPGRWDKHKEEYSEVQRAIDNLQAEHGFSKAELRLLLICDKTERSIEMLKAMYIAQEELEAA